MKNKLISIFTILAVLCSSLITVNAIARTPKIELDEYQLKSNDKNNVYVSGTINISVGQDVGVYDSNGKIMYNSVKLENTNSSSSFRLQVPSRYLNEGNNTFKVKSTPVKNVINGSNPKTITVNINTSSKINQTITANNITVKKGETKSLNAKVTSGLPLTYLSNNPTIATVDAKGNVLGRSKGSTTITISQSGNDKYNPVSKTITVTVTDNTPVSKDTYTIIYNSNGGKGNTPPQKAIIGQSTKLNSNKFTRDGYTFVGWATKDTKSVISGKDVTKFKNVDMKHFQLGKVKYKNGQSVKNLASKNKSITLYAVWKGSGQEAAADWATLVAADKHFGYNFFGGHNGKNYSKKHPSGARQNHFGCYFCKTNNMSKKYCWRGGKTYVCMTFVDAAYAHGANCSAFWKKSKKSCNPTYINGNAIISKVKRNCKAIKSVGHPSANKAKKGDILIKNDTHVMIYTGRIGKKYYISEAGTGCGIRTKSYSKSGINKVFKKYTVFRLK